MLAIECSETAGSVALGEWTEAIGVTAMRVVAANRLDPAMRSARSLAPVIDEILRGAGWTPGGAVSDEAVSDRATENRLAAVAVSVGPGSFTGLRTGISTARMIAWALDAGLIAVDTRDVIAETVFHASACGAADSVPETLAVWIDAQRGQVVTAMYLGVGRCAAVDMADGDAKNIARWERIAVSDRPRAMDEVIRCDLCEDRDTTRTKQVGLAGTIFGRASVVAKLPEPLRSGIVAEPLRTPDAAAVLRIAARKMAAGEFADLRELRPLYSRPSAAEERIESLPAH